MLPVRLSCHRSIGQSVIHCLFLCPLCCLSDYHATALSVSWSFIVYSCALYVACQIIMPLLYRSVGHSSFILAPFMLPVRLSCHCSIGQSVIHCLLLLPLCCLSDYDATVLSVSRSFFVYSCDLCCLSDYHATALSVSRSFFVYCCSLYAACQIMMPPFYRSVGHSSCILVTYAACQIIMPPLYRSVGHSSFILVPFMLPVRLSCHRSIGQSVIHPLFLCPLCCLSDYHATALSVSRSFIVYSCALYAACQIIMPPLYRSVGH